VVWLEQTAAESAAVSVWKLNLFDTARTKALLEAVDTATGLGHFLTACVERVAGCAYIEVDVAAQRRASNNGVTAAAFCGDFGVFRVDIGFHG